MDLQYKKYEIVKNMKYLSLILSIAVLLYLLPGCKEKTKDLAGPVVDPD